MDEQPRHDDLTHYLVRAVLDPEFCALARRAPDEAFAGYELTDDERDTLRSGDEGILRLLGLALRGEAATAAPTEADSVEADPVEAAAPTPVALQPVTLLLTVQPYALSTPEGIRMSFTSTVAPAPAGLESTEPEPAPPSPATESPETGATWSPWEHDLDSERTRAAAAAVREAAPEERRERILALLAAMTARERLGGDGVGPDG